MHTTPPLSSDEFDAMIERMRASASAELSATKARLDALRTEESPPG